MVGLIQSRIKNVQDINLPVTPINKKVVHTEEQCTILYETAGDDDCLEITQMAIQKGADPRKLCYWERKFDRKSSCLDSECYPIQRAVWQGAVNTVRYLLTVCKVNPHTTDRHLNTLLHYATWNKDATSQFAIMQMLLEYDKNVNFCNELGQTALFRFSERGDESHRVVIRLLLEKGARTDIYDFRGYTPIGSGRQYHNEGADMIEEEVLAMRLIAEKDTYIKLLPTDLTHYVSQIVIKNNG